MTVSRYETTPLVTFAGVMAIMAIQQGGVPRWWSFALVAAGCALQAVLLRRQKNRKARA